ncbi:MAG: molybdopterin-guanine dinucleotide biosynthesis protein B [Deltaproteobacteria bacterium]|nr:molybdopterin-guanine dinucleotide biosynthesis protein B [Deltaproteobacteria bacterium]
MGTIKHAHHGFDLDKKGKDSYNHKAAGADAVMIAGPGKIALIKDEPITRLAGLEKYFSEMDLVLAEGFKRENNPKIEVFRSEGGAEPLRIKENLIAFVTDSDIDLAAPKFGLDDIEKLAEMVIEKFITA